MKHPAVAGFTLGLAALVGGCSGETPQGDSDAPGQVIARVNGEEISFLQYRRALHLARVQAPSAAARQEIIDKLVDRELAVQQAVELGLHRTPDVLMELEAARRDVLARAWAEQVARSVGPPNDSGAARYYRDNPQLFAERRIYHLREAALGAGNELFDETKQRLVAGEGLAEVLDWLHGQGVAIRDQVVVRAVEQLPMETLPRLATTAPGGSAYFETSGGWLIYCMYRIPHSCRANTRR